MDKSRGAVALQMPYLRVVDLQEESEAHANDTFSNAGEAGGGGATAAFELLHGALLDVATYSLVLLPPVAASCFLLFAHH
jgi:hypothetical protein